MIGSIRCPARSHHCALMHHVQRKLKLYSSITKLWAISELNILWISMICTIPQLLGVVQRYRYWKFTLEGVQDRMYRMLQKAQQHWGLPFIVTIIIVERPWDKCIHDLFSYKPLFTHQPNRKGFSIPTMHFLCEITILFAIKKNCEAFIVQVHTNGMLLWKQATTIMRIQQHCCPYSRLAKPLR